jgi:cell division septation protein DedD
MTAREKVSMARGIAAAMAVCAVAGLALVGGVTAANAEPNTQTVLPTDGVLSVVRTGDAWTVLTAGPASEIKYMGPGAQQIVCGINYGDPCSTVETFAVAGECVYLQLDGIPGENSSDPYICLGGTSSTSTPVATEPAPTSPAPTPTTTTPATQSPSPSPSPSVTSTPTSTQEPSSPRPSVSTEIRVGMSSGSAAVTSGYGTSAPARLADTGRRVTIWGLGLLMAATLAIGLGLLTIVRRSNP